MDTILNNLIANKKVCLLCCGSSLDSHNIDYESYDIVCGVNRIYKTGYFKYIDILFDGCHYKYDPLTPQKIKLLNHSKLKYIIFSGGSKLFTSKFIKQISKLDVKFKFKSRNIVNNFKISIGTEALFSLHEAHPSRLDVYGLDFYSSDYTKELSHEICHTDHSNTKRHNYKLEKEQCLALAENLREIVTIY